MQQLYLQQCNKSAISIRANLEWMEQGLEADQALVRALVEWAAMAPSKVASEAGLAATTITRPFKGTAVTQISRPTLDKLRSRFPDFPGWNNNVRSEVSTFGDRPFEEKFGLGELPAIPVVGSAIGMKSFDPERDIELTELDMSDVLDRVARPASLARDNEAYALTVIGDSMYPRFRPGRRVIVSPRAPVSIGDDVVVQLKGPDVEDQYKERITTVLIKELARRSATFVELRQFNPDVTFRVEMSRVAAIHKVIGEVY